MSHIISNAYDLINEYKSDPPPDKEWLEVQLHRLDGQIKRLTRIYESELNPRHKSDDISERREALGIVSNFRDTWYSQWQHLQ